MQKHVETFALFLKKTTFWNYNIQMKIVFHFNSENPCHLLKIWEALESHI